MVTKSVSDAALLQEYLKVGTDDAFRQLIKRYTPLVFGTCYRLLGHVDRAEDAAQSTFVALALKAARIDASRGLGGWLHRVARQISLDMHKAGVRRQAREQEAWRRTDMRVKPEEHPHGCVATELDEAVNRLPAKLRIVVIQHYFEEVSVEDIAIRQGCTPSAISMRLTRARALLHKRLSRQGLARTVVFDLAALVKSSAPLAQPSLFVDAAARTVAAALKGGAAVEPVAVHAVALAQRALHRLLLWRLRWGLAGGVTAVLGLAAVPMIRSQASPAEAAPVTPVPKLRLVAAAPEVPTPSATPVIAVSPARTATDPQLIAALRKSLPFEKLPEFKTLLDGTGGSLDAIRDTAGRTALHWAARGGDEEPALLLLLRGASPNTPDGAGRTPLFDTIERGDKWMALLFVLAKADVNRLANDGSSPLLLAVRRGDLQLSEWLLWLGANPHLAGQADAVQPDLLARTSSNPEMARLLDDYSALRHQTFVQQPQVLPEMIRNGLQDAARRGDLIRLDKLLSSGLNINT